MRVETYKSDVPSMRIELTTLGLLDPRSNQLSYEGTWINRDKLKYMFLNFVLHVGRGADRTLRGTPRPEPRRTDESKKSSSVFRQYYGRAPSRSGSGGLWLFSSFPGVPPNPRPPSKDWRRQTDSWIPLLVSVSCEVCVW